MNDAAYLLKSVAQKTGIPQVTLLDAACVAYQQVWPAGTWSKFKEAWGLALEGCALPRDQAQDVLKLIEGEPAFDSFTSEELGGPGFLYNNYQDLLCEFEAQANDYTAEYSTQQEPAWHQEGQASELTRENPGKLIVEHLDDDELHLGL
ncbi:hypothetical protein SSP24_72410 [Streptomyces spinoverrucosus]|uniref:Uncharacterized protein n=1 Tax=Streptomyces spinoverrucosus TaxID=284043 RepID=A0A4Y3VX33_9ACTN|nr:hypothetical protein [Streptomyces spinoverrucosus]GEC09586.1 hypothetical protein SSP24_72410 [Streptomyces spinoverrucosus]GHB96120.1 hypothetical protein GCM10010397_81010 [Streptomyces spinoverrucosus]